MSDLANGQSAAHVFDRFVAAINRQDVDALAALMTPDHLFVDGAGQRFAGRAVMHDGWRRYFQMCPDYWVRVDKSLADSTTVLAVGEAGGTVDDTSWRTPAAWQAVIRDGLVLEWRVFADNREICAILARRKP